METSIFKRGMALFLALLLCFTTFISSAVTPAFAAGTESEVCVISFPREGDSNYSANWGHSDLNFMGGWHDKATRFLSVHAVGSFTGEICYCIEPGVNALIGDKVTQQDESFWDNYPSNLNPTISPDDIKLLIGRIMQYGYTGTVSIDWRSQNEGGAKLAWATATQLLIWETVVGERDAEFNKVAPPAGKDAILSEIDAENPLYTMIMNYYSSIAYNVQNHTLLPSFFARSTNRAQEVELKWDGSRYSATLTDTNNVLSLYTFTANAPRVYCAVSGNQLTISSDTTTDGPVSITASKINSQRRGIITWTDGHTGPDGTVQDLVTYTQSVTDPIQGYLNVKISLGSMKIVKTSEDGNVAGIPFTVSGNGINRTIYTTSAGEIQVDNLTPGTYTVTEQPFDQYAPQESRQVTVVSGQTATVTFNNTLRRGDLVVTKTAEDGLVEGVKFHLYGTSMSGIPVDEYAVTDSTGRAYFRDVLAGTGYTLEELDVPGRYVVPDSQSAAIEWNTVTQKSFENRLKKWNATVTKQDGETGAAQGDASLAGATYGVYKGNELIDTYTTDATGRFTTNYYTCGDDWSIREIDPSEGYLLDSASYHVGAEPKNYTAEYNSVSLNVTEQVMKGKIAIIKHTDSGETQLETPEAGAEFVVYLKSSGSYEAAKETERDHLVCDGNGFAETKDLPYGVYTVHQTLGWEGRELLPDFDVYIAKDGQTYRYLANNAMFESYIKIVKVDAETGKAIPYAGAGFQLYRPDGSKVEQTFTYPDLTTIDTFYTNAEGYLITPEPLEFGSGYYLVEVAAPLGYVLDSTPVYFDVTEENAVKEGPVFLVEVVKANVAQKGIIKINKTGEVFSTVIESGGIYQPIFEVQGLPGAVFEITAAEDIYTADGTLRYSAGEVVDTLTTGTGGAAESKPLYLGKFEIREVTAPSGMVAGKEVHTVELTYAGQEVEITETAASVLNERQKVAVTLEKAMEQDERFGIGMNGEITAVTFGLYAAENLTAADGTSIPADGLVEIVSVSEDGHGTVSTDLPMGSYYLKEQATDSHYVLSDEKYPVVFEYAGQDTAMVNIKANDGAAIGNRLIYGSVHGLKKDDDGNALAGALMGLFRADETEFTADNALMTATSSGDGSFGFDRVPYGNWLVREIESPTGYLLSEVSYPVEISKDGAVVEVEVENTRIRGTVQLTKVDEDYPDNKLTGAEFDVYRDSNGNKELDAGDELVGAMTEVSTGVYELDGVEFGGHFVKERVAPEGFCLDESAHYFEITAHNEVVVVENEAGVGFVNAAQVGSLKIVKTSSDKNVEGFSFRVTGPNGYEQVFTTNADGEILIEGLRIGEYQVSEVLNEKSANYVLPADKTAGVLADSVTTVQMHNELRDTPKTGDDSNPALWAALMGVSVLGAGACGMVYVKTRKKNEDVE